MTLTIHSHAIDGTTELYDGRRLSITVHGDESDPEARKALARRVAGMEAVEEALAFYRDNWCWYPVGDEGDGVTDFGRVDGYEAEPSRALKDDAGQRAAAALEGVSTPPRLEDEAVRQADGPTEEDAPDAIYRLYLNTPDAGRSSYLHDHYRRGYADIQRPGSTAPVADAAWRAGRRRAVEGNPLCPTPGRSALSKGEAEHG